MLADGVDIVVGSPFSRQTRVRQANLVEPSDQRPGGTSPQTPVSCWRTLSASYASLAMDGPIHCRHARLGGSDSRAENRSTGWLGSLGPSLAAVILALSLASEGCSSLSQLSNTAVTLDALVTDSAAFDGRLITLTGLVENVRLVPGLRSEPRRVFDLSNGSQSVRVIWRGWPVCRSGVMATVEGRFRRLDGLIEATWVTCS